MRHRVLPLHNPVHGGGQAERECPHLRPVRLLRLLVRLLPDAHHLYDTPAAEGEAAVPDQGRHFRRLPVDDDLHRLRTVPDVQ